MLLTITRMGSSASFLGLLINKCRQVIKKDLPHKHIDNNEIPENLSTSPNTNPYRTTNATTNKTLINSDESYRTDAVRKLASVSSVKAAKSLEEQIGLPPKPKKPLTPYFRFMRDQRSKVQAANPKWSIPDVVRQMSKDWVTTDPSLKERLTEEYNRDQKVYVEKRTKYEATITEEQRKKIKELKLELQDAKQKRILRKRIKELGRPKRPSSAFLKFISSERASTPQLPQQTFSEWRKKAIAKWNRLSEAEKHIYIQESRKDFEEYKKKISVWEESMIKLGHVDVIRNTNIVGPPQLKSKKL